MAQSVQRKPAVGFIFITLVLLILGVGIIVPVLPGLVTEFRGGSVSEGSWDYGLIIGVFAATQFVAAPILGSLSDRYGRRRVLLIALAGSAIDYVVMGFAPTLTWLFIARIISGATAGSLATCNAYIADVTPPEKRAQAFGLLGAAFGLGFVIGPAIGGLAGSVSLRLPFFIAAGCVAINWVYGAFVLPESLPVQHRRNFSWKRANPIGAFRILQQVPGLLRLAIVYFLSMFGGIILQNIWVLYTGYRYHWTTAQVGLSLTVVGILSAIVQGRLVRPIIAWLGEKRALFTGLTLNVAAYILYGSAPRGWMIYCILLIGSLGGIAGPALQSFITRHVAANEQGAVQGSLSGLTSLGTIFAPLLGSWSFAYFVSPTSRWQIPGIAFYEAAAIALIGLLLARRALRSEKSLVGPDATARAAS